ncbi:HAMP domain-containing protein [Mucilaginibacter pallidiroseus]|uniref:histidine kinase n=1 Tax=Mucilaginibacter pallidiroseus TaxID=2599295 RepID=A0A563UI59_9SPHI|nr:histidine kinase dimerization/phospho-acceptor domain-containing protein [Mucilaginibacter pallidiroseus]TWR30938.1 HAMP domain-containing protein [Mucilaginibacter pallidiroseus]
MKLTFISGIKLKITVAFSLVFVSLSLVFNLYCYQRIKSLLINDNNKYLLDRAERYLSKIDVSPVIIPLPGNNTMIRVLNHSRNNHHILFESPGIIRKIPTPVKTGVTDTLNQRVTFVTNVIEDNPAELVLVTDGTQLNKSLDYLLILLISCSLASVVIAALVSYILAYSLLRPVQKIINASNVINTNQLKELIPVEETGDELQELTETINRMLIRIESSLQQQQNFFASASHELKTPLAIMKAELELGLIKKGVDPELKALLSSQLDEINRLQMVVQEFLMISELKNGSLKAYKEPVDIAAFVVKAFHHLQPLLAAKNLKPEITFNKNVSDFTISADKDKIWITLLNVIENAIKYSPDAGSISCLVEECPHKPALVICVTNATTHEKINTDFLQNAFYRADAIQSGNGMGLWLSNQLLSAQGGELQLVSADYTFTAKLILLI